MAVGDYADMDVTMGESGYELNLTESGKVEHPSWLPPHMANQDTLTDIIDSQSNISHMSMDTSVALHQFDRSRHGTSPGTPTFSTSPEVTEGDITEDVHIKHEENFEMEIDDMENHEHTNGDESGEYNGEASGSPQDQLLQEPERQNDVPSPAKKRRISSKTPQLKFTDFRSRTSINSEELPREELARQGIEAALSSRLNPYTMHHEEYRMLRPHLSRSHVTTYLNIRNRILRLWVRNPLVSVTPEEAAGCAPSDRFLSLAQVAYDWLVRRGYINFGCVEIPDFTVMTKRLPKITKRRRRIVVIGAGMSGLGCARQLEGLSNHYRQSWTSKGEEPPEVVVLEGRARLGGRIYSIPLKDQDGPPCYTSGIPSTARATAETGAHIITGFDHGNPLNMLVRGQLAIPYYALKDNSRLYDVDGRIVDQKRDRMAQKLFNDVLERASAFRHKLSNPKTVDGDRDAIEAGKDGSDDTILTIAQEEEGVDGSESKPSPPRQQSAQVPIGTDKLTGKAFMAPGEPTNAPPVEKAESIGFEAAQGEQRPRELNLDEVAHAKQFPTLGEVMDEGVRQYHELMNLTPQDLRLINWHFANLEYANAAKVSELSLGGWDQDGGNEFDGEHTQVIGGYIQVPRGLYQAPNELDMRTRKAVSKIVYSSSSNPRNADDWGAEITCADGEVVSCDYVVSTVPLGVLKTNSIAFEPALPDWKRNSISKLGFGLLNKIILVFKEPFWDVDRDMIGLLRDTLNPSSPKQEDYAANRGRFYFFWNCIKTTGRPVLIALMAGDAAHQAEARTDDELTLEVIQQLAQMFKQSAGTLPKPVETIVTRWGKDKFARGTYSYVAPEAHSDDYDNMAKQVGNLYFAGEATCGTHPATVHGAYISGLRAAGDVVDDMLGPIEIPLPLVPDAIKVEPTVREPAVLPAVAIRPPSAPLSNGETDTERQTRLQGIENEILGTILDKLGPRPDKPEKAGANPFLLFSKDKWAECKAECDSQTQAIRKDPTAKASRNEVRAALGKMWRESSEEVKKPYIELTQENRANNKDAKTIFKDRLENWDAAAIALRREYIREHPNALSHDEEQNMWVALGVVGAGERRAKVESGLADAYNADSLPM